MSTTRILVNRPGHRHSWSEVPRDVVARRVGAALVERVVGTSREAVRRDPADRPWRMGGSGPDEARRAVVVGRRVIGVRR